MINQQWLNPEDHPLYGKDTTCHKCSGTSVWVFNGDMVGNYHYCRACKVETGPFAADVTLPALEPRPSLPEEYYWASGLSNFITDPKTTYILQRRASLEAAMETEKRWEQMSFELSPLAVFDLCWDEETD